MDDTVRGTHGYTGQGAGYGYSKVKDLNALLATLSTPAAAPVCCPSLILQMMASSTLPTVWMREGPVRWLRTGPWSSR
jgi:hypothetical protein